MVNTSNSRSGGQGQVLHGNETRIKLRPFGHLACERLYLFRPLFRSLKSTLPVINLTPVIDTAEEF